MNVGDVVWWVGAPGTRRKVQLREDRGDRFIYRTVGGRVGWEADAPKEQFQPIGKAARVRT